jgi:signal transduction histidine kinase
MEYRLRRHDGEYRWVLDRGIPRYAAGGEFVGYVGTAIDLTDRRLAEEARQDLVHASRLAVLGEFTAMIAHELNQPLYAILVNADAMNALLELGNAPMEELRLIVEDIRRDDRRATEAIRRIRALVSKRGMEMHPLDMNETVSEVVRMATGDASRRRVQIDEEYCEQLPIVQGDIIHLQQVMLNLILNGMDAMKDSPIFERRLLVTTHCNGNGTVEVSVRDSGHGIPPENLPRVFDSFFTTKPNGIGIGLSMARSIIQLHAGRLWAENNKEGKGTTFRFTLPTITMVPTLLRVGANTEEKFAGKA